jgi:hypothetical protein
MLSPLATAVRFVPMGCLGEFGLACGIKTYLTIPLTGFCVTMSLALLFNWLSIKTLVVGGLTISVIANVSSAIAQPGDSFWAVSYELSTSFRLTAKLDALAVLLRRLNPGCYLLINRLQRPGRRPGRIGSHKRQEPGR